MKAFIDISADKIGIYWLWAPFFMERTGVDIHLWKKLVELDREYGITECLILNWPWGFTNLRVWTLALNLLKTLKNDKIVFYNISKPELYKIFYEKWRIPRYGIIYIWQKCNVWLRDIKQNIQIKTIKKDSISDVKNEYWEIFFDQVYDEGYFDSAENKLSFSFENEKLFLINPIKNHLDRRELIINKVDKIEANYMIEPNVS